ncbi:MAG TPA: nucleoside triphosphate pyrophosphohydrolase [Clostridiales bacterium]|jgi:tetrapyrrole methylase family protein/MazG family protein|nr:nucleoside triphosphate pyrophosphohydrolase [Clostridiales bacterium]
MNRDEKIRYLLGAEHYGTEDLRLLVELLRSEGGCPWDREQTHQSIRAGLIEETYEVVEAIDKDDPSLMCEELGDLLLQVIFHTQIETEGGNFTLGDVTDNVCRKLIHRHPHVFGDLRVGSTDEVLANWDRIKSEEKCRLTITDKLRAVPAALPALMRAVKVGKRASCLDFPDAGAVMDKIHEETDELSAAIASGDTEWIDEELGDLLLTVSSLARKIDIDPEAALNRATDKFIDRFERVENKARQAGLDINKTKMTELDKIWNKIK